MSSTGPDRRCAVCGGPLHAGFTHCYCCITVVRQLGQPLAPVVAVAEYRVGDRMHRRLRGYKDAPVSEVRRERVEALAGMAERWLLGHCDRLAERFGGAWDAVATVPSSCRPGSSPVDAVVRRVPSLEGCRVPMLERGPGRLDHLEASPRGFVLRPGVDRAWLAGRRVLVVDDTFSTGARAQSAVAAIRSGGATVVGILVLGRVMPRAPGAAPAPGPEG